MHDLIDTLDRVRDAVLAGDFKDLAPICSDLETSLAGAANLTQAEAELVRAARAAEEAVRHAFQQRMALDLEIRHVRHQGCG